ncbi:peptidyl-prolyl cis-trans isomerase [Maribacter chungangensis]|uniref:Peptidyl-prolyl cis-trans isomerase n=1 Tax=Maribacter chungangensis TaxID=1069117 RepID=A0ABW3B5E3_9FLAO
MLSFQTLRKRPVFAHLAAYVLSGFLLGSCSSYFKKNEDIAPLARVGENYLYPADVAVYITDGMSESDSASFVNNYITTWASKQLLLSKAKINLQEDKLRKFDALVADYKTDLYTRAYKEALVSQGSDSLVTTEQLTQFYEEEKANFKLKERIVQLRFVALPKNFLNKEEVSQRLKNFNQEDISYLDSIGVQFKKLHFNDSIWVRASRVLSEIPPINLENQDRYLKKSQFFELEDSIGVYLGKIEEVKDLNDIAPLSFIAPTIKQVLLNRRKINYLRKLETEIIDEAIKDKEFEVYAKEQ